jgi:uncharacterized protein YbjT (DUF2867 family)
MGGSHMRVMLLGANGFIGQAVLVALVKAGHEVVAVTRSAKSLPAAIQVIPIDIARFTRPEDWNQHLSGIDAIVNCAGLLQASPGQSVKGVHVEGISALFHACENRGVRRVVHFSAIGADREQPSEFSRTKLESERALMARALDWVILRPSVVVGRAAYGGSALFRGLAAFPILPVLPGTGPLQIVQLDEVVATVLFFIRRDAPSRLALDIAGPERLSFTDVVSTYRRWLGWKPALRLSCPPALAKLAYKLGDLAGWLGWRPPIRTTAREEIVRGAVGDNAEWQRLTGIAPQRLQDALSAEPASVQERWFAQLYLLKGLAFPVFAAFWIATGLVSLGPGWDIGKSLMFEGGVEDPLASLVVVAGALADIAIGTAIAFRRTTRLGLYAALGISIAYTVIGTILVPRLWEDPLGPMLKIWPIMAFNLLLLAIHKDR